MKAQMQVMDASGNKLGVLQAKYTGLGNVLQANQKQIEILTDRYKKSYDENGKATSATIKYANQLNQATARQASYEAQIKQTIGAYAELQTKTTGITGVINKTSDVLQKAGNSAQNIGTSLTHGVTIPIAGAVTAVTTAAVKWESAFAGVKKTNDEIVDSNGNIVYSYSDLEKGLRDLAKELPASHEEIAGVAEATGQLGIQTDNVVSFTKTMIDLGESTNMSAETAATSFARFANITQMSQKDFERLGAVVVDLGNNLATTESEITEMGLRLAGAGKQVGMSQAEIMSFAAALSSVGIEAEAGGTAFSKVMVQMQLAVEKGVGALEPLKQTVSRYGYSWEQFVHAITWGGKELTDLSKKIGISSKDLKEMYKNASESAGSLSSFADVTGRTSDEFAKLFKSNPSQAIIEFVKGLGEAEKHGTSAISILSDMDIKEVRLRDSLLRAANASGVFEGAIKRGTQAWEENTALTDEANNGSDQTGDGSEENPFATIQMAFNQVPLITIPSVTIWIDSGVYLEDAVLRNVNVTSVYVRCRDNIDNIDVSTSDLPVKVRSIAFYYVRGYIQVSGLQFVDTANGPTYGGSIYQLLADQSGYMSVVKCKFANDNRNTASMGICINGTSQCHVYNGTYFYKQNIAIRAKFMGTILISDIVGSQNVVGAQSDDGLIRREPPTSFADTQTKVTGCGLYIKKGLVLG
ncbi:phage tail tape measure protein [Enterococcus hirae]